MLNAWHRILYITGFLVYYVTSYFLPVLEVSQLVIDGTRDPCSSGTCLNASSPGNSLIPSG